MVSESDTKSMLQETQWIRKLLMLQALSSGYKQKDLARVLGVSEATMSRMMPKGLAKLGNRNGSSHGGLDGDIAR